MLGLENLCEMVLRPKKLQNQVIIVVGDFGPKEFTLRTGSIICI